MSKPVFKTSLAKWTFEFFLIVLGVTIALWLENVAEDLKEREIEQQYLVSFSQDVKSNIFRLNHSIKVNQELAAKVDNLLGNLLTGSLTVKQLPQEIDVLMNYDYFKPEDFTLTSIRESGDFRLLKDSEIKRKILQTTRTYNYINELQVNYQKALDDQIVPMVIKNINLITGELVNTEFIKGHQLVNILGYASNDIKQRVKSYQRALEQTESLKTLLESSTDNNK